MKNLSRRKFGVLIGAAMLVGVASPAKATGRQEWLEALAAELSRHHDEDIPFEVPSPALEKITREHFQAFLERLRQDGKLFAFDVICDDRNNSPQTRDLGEHNLQICIYEAENSKPIIVNTAKTNNFISFDALCGKEGAAGSAGS